MQELTQSQQIVLDAIVLLWERQGYPPTQYEIAAETKKSPQATYFTIGILHKKGYIEKHKHKARSIRVMHTNGSENE
ncbi:putative LexA family transcriptional regulator [Xenohaliotis phage pCXc-HC2016]|nr:putative LexA family transcriptional regulator [Xenohaliotis phage pCXc-HC2016]AQW89109.1 putative LexA family transcriptional regulator [Xenohaliotis phage pCXc-HR2015]